MKIRHLVLLKWPVWLAIFWSINLFLYYLKASGDTSVTKIILSVWKRKKHFKIIRQVFWRTPLFHILYRFPSLCEDVTSQKTFSTNTKNHGITSNHYFSLIYVWGAFKINQINRYLRDTTKGLRPERLVMFGNDNRYQSGSRSRYLSRLKYCESRVDWYRKWLLLSSLFVTDRDCSWLRNEKRKWQFWPYFKNFQIILLIHNLNIISLLILINI